MGRRSLERSSFSAFASLDPDGPRSLLLHPDRLCPTSAAMPEVSHAARCRPLGRRRGVRVRRLRHSFRRAFGGRPPHGRRRPRRGAVVRTLADEAARIHLGAVAGRALRAVLDPDPARPRPRARLLSERRSGVKPQLLDAYRTLDAYPEAAGVLTRLRERGAKTGILSNGDPGMLGDAVASAGLGTLLDAVLSIDAVRIFKTSPRTYALVDSTFGTRTEKVVFVSSNRWDIAGAAAFGFRPVWVNRAGLPDEYPGLEPVAAVADLSVLA